MNVHSPLVGVYICSFAWRHRCNFYTLRRKIFQLRTLSSKHSKTCYENILTPYISSLKVKQRKLKYFQTSRQHKTSWWLMKKYFKCTKNFAFAIICSIFDCKRHSKFCSKSKTLVIFHIQRFLVFSKHNQGFLWNQCGIVWNRVGYFSMKGFYFFSI